MTGLHSVADIYCKECSSRLGWKYLEAFESRYTLTAHSLSAAQRERAWMHASPARAG